MLRLAGTLAASAVLALSPVSSGSVSVAYAGSLVQTMQGPLAAALQRDTGLRFAGEPGGSKELANLIRAGLREPDVFITADPSVLRRLPVEDVQVLGHARLLIGYSPHSSYRKLFEQAARGQRSILSVLETAGVKIGRTDPRLDPKGSLTIRAVEMLARDEHDPGAAATILRRAAVFPEESLFVRVETANLDAGFFYSTETSGRRLPVIELPPNAALSHEITYAVAIQRTAPHPRAARIFVHYIMQGRGRAILQQAGLDTP